MNTLCCIVKEVVEERRKNSGERSQISLWWVLMVTKAIATYTTTIHDGKLVCMCVCLQAHGGMVMVVKKKCFASEKNIYIYQVTLCGISTSWKKWGKEINSRVCSIHSTTGHVTLFFLLGIKRKWDFLWEMSDFSQSCFTHSFHLAKLVQQNKKILSLWENVSSMATQTSFRSFSSIKK